MKKVINDLTVFIIASGEDTEKDCLAALQKQDCLFNIEYIRDVAPMSSAFQSMPDMSTTKYFIQVDADMVLEENAVSMLYESVKSSPFWIYRTSYALYEEGFGVGGAVKCWKKSIFKYFKFSDLRTVDRSFHKKVRWFGFSYRHINKVIGAHRPRHSVFSMYLKSKSDVEKWRYLKRKPEKYAIPLLNEVLTQDEDAFFVYRVLGILLGAVTKKNILIRSKNSIYERELYSKIDKVLPNDLENAKQNIIKCDKTNLILLFSKSYSNITDNPTCVRRDLLMMIVDLFDISCNADAVSSLKIL